MVAPGTVIRCTFCGAERRAGAAPPPVQPWGAPRAGVQFPQGAPVKVSPLLFVLPFGLVLFGVGFSLLMAHRAQRVATAAGGLAGVMPGEHVLQMSELATSPSGRGWELVDAPGMVGTLDAFDVIANMPWAVTIARAWAPDARLHRVDFGRTEKSGQVNLRTIPDATSGYRFVSPLRVAEYENSTALVDSKIVTELMIQVDKDGVKVLKSSSNEYSGEDLPNLAPPVCTLGQALAAIEKAGKLPPRPVYSGYLIEVSPKRTAYYINTLTGSPNIPTVNASSCKLD